MTQYYILVYPGAGQWFLTALVAQYLNISIDVSISLDGDCHNLGNGIYNGSENIEPVGWYLDIDDTNKKSILTGHYNNTKHIKQVFPNIKIILINVRQSDMKYSTIMRFYKAMYPLSEKDYNKWTTKFKITHWPKYGSELNNKLDMVKNDIIKFDQEWHKEWSNDIDHSQIDHVIDYRTIFGLNDISLNQKLAAILDQEINPTIDKFIEKYQRINQTLYFNK